MTAEDVLQALEDLSPEELDKFKWYLSEPGILPGFPNIKKVYLKSTTSIEGAVDLMVSTYTIQRCMEVTSKIFEKMNKNDLLQSLIKKMRMKVEPMFEKRRLKIKEIKDLVKSSKYAADKEKTEGILIYTALKESIERDLKELIKEIEDKQKTTEKEAEDFIKDLEQEMSEMMKRSSEVDFLESSFFLLDNQPKKDWVEERVHPPSYEGTVDRAVARLKETLWENMKNQLELIRVQQYAVDLTLDPKTAHPRLVLSDDRKQVKHENDWQNLPDNPERFTLFPKILAEQSFSSGRFYFEVQVKGKTDWDLGVVKESVDRKGEVCLNIDSGFWVLMLRQGNKYTTGEDISVRFDLQPGPEKIGVFVDYEKGLVSFYNVDAAKRIYSFTDCQFTEKLYPFFSPFVNNGGRNSAPLIIRPVNKADRCSN